MGGSYKLPCLVSASSCSNVSQHGHTSTVQMPLIILLVFSTLVFKSPSPQLNKPRTLKAKPHPEHTSSTNHHCLILVRFLAFLFTPERAEPPWRIRRRQEETYRATRVKRKDEPLLIAAGAAADSSHVVNRVWNSCLHGISVWQMAEETLKRQKRVSLSALTSPLESFWHTSGQWTAYL